MYRDERARCHCRERAGSAADLDPLGLSQRVYLNGLHQGQRLHCSLHHSQADGGLSLCQLLPHSRLMLLLVSLAVLPQVGEGAVALPTVRAGVGPLIRVNAAVFCQAHRDGKGLATLFTGKGTLTCVQAPVVLQVGTLAEGLAAVWTRVWPLACVDALVNLQ